MPEFRYKAFLSYSQAADGRLCEILQSRLQRFATPWYRRRSIRVFRDTTGLGPTPDMWESIQTALLSSEYLILLASERSAHSPWVMQEVDTFLTHGSADRLLIAWTDGELAWDRAAGDFDWSRTTCLPRRLQGAFHAEPMYLDLRWARTATDLSPRRSEFVDAVARLSATLRQLPMDDLVGEDIRHYRTTRRVAASAIVALTILLIGALVGAVVALQQRNVAREQRAVAEQRTEESRQRLVRLMVTNGIRRLDEQDLAAGALWFAEAVDLESAPADRELQRLRLRSSLAQHPRLRQLWSTERSPDRRTLGRQVGFGRADRYAVTLAWEGDLAMPSGGSPEFVLAPPIEPRVWDVATAARIPIEVPAGERLLTVDADAGGPITASVDGEGGVHVRNVTSHAELSVMKHPCMVTGAELSDDRSALWTECDDRVIRVWDAASGTLRASLPHEADITFSLMSGGGKRLLSGTADNVAHIWTLGTGGRAASQIELPHDSTLQEIHDGMNGQRVLTLAGYEARLWDVDTGAEPVLIETWIDVNHIAISPDGERVAFATGYGQAAVHDIETGRELFHVQHDDVVFDVVFSADGRRLLTGSRDRSARIWETREGRPVAAPLSHESSVSGVSFSSTGLQVATITEDETVRIWDLTPKPRHPHEYVKTVEFFPDGKHVLTAGDADAKVWDTSAWAAVTIAPGSQLYHASISPDGQRIATGSQDGVVRVWNAATGMEEKRFTHGRAVRRVAFSPDGRRLASAGQVQGRHEVMIWDLSTGSKLMTLAHDSSYLTDMAFSPDGQRLLTIASDELRVWDLTQGREVPGLRIAEVRRAVWDATGARLAVAAAGVQVVDATTGKLLFPAIQQDNYRVTDVKFASGGAAIAIATEGGFVRLWSTEDGQPVAPPFGHGRGTFVRHIATSADGAVLATSGTDGTLRLWDARTGQAATPALPHPEIVQAAFSPDRGRIVTVGDDVREWDLGAAAFPGSDVDLRGWARLLAARTIDATGAESTMTAADIRAAWAARPAR